MKLLIQRYFLLWGIDHEAALVLTVLTLSWIGLTAWMFYLIIKAIAT